MRRLSVHDVPIAELAKMAASDPQCEDGGYDCVVCGGPFSVPDDLEPTPLCDPCAQTAAVRLAKHIAVILDSRGTKSLDTHYFRHAEKCHGDCNGADNEPTCAGQWGNPHGFPTMCRARNHK